MFNSEALFKKVLPKGSNLVKDAGLSSAFLQSTNISVLRQNADNFIATAENSFANGGVDQIADFKNSATASLESLKNNISPHIDKTITAVTGEFNNLAGNLKEEANKALDSAGKVVEGIDGSITLEMSKPLKSEKDPVETANPHEGEELRDVVVTAVRPRTNPLEKFVSANYVITLGCLTNEELADPDNTYMLNGGAKIVILKSGGGSNALGKEKITTSMEGKHGRTEYFLEDLNIQSVVNPNEGSRTVAYHQMTFKIVEPYSMGQFLEALEIGAREAGHSNYVQAPFMISLDWVGYLQEPDKDNLFHDVGTVTRLSQMAGESGRHLPISIFQADMSITARGTEYECQAIAYNATALTDAVQQIPIDIAISGKTVEELLQSSPTSLTTVLNSNLLKKEKEDKRAFADEYIVLFPTKEETKGTAQNQESGKKLDKAVVTERDINEGSGKDIFVKGKTNHDQLRETLTKVDDFSFEDWAKKILGISLKRNRLSEALKSDTVTQSNVNNIGKATIKFSDLQEGDQEANPTGLIYSVEKDCFVTSAVQISKATNQLKFAAGTKFNKIIEEVVLISKFGRGLLEQAVKPSGAKQWFRIETQVFNIPLKAAEAQRGKPPKLYVFRVIPYDVNMSLIEKPTELMHGEDELKNQIVKYYEYIYTGQNKDILDLDLQLTTRFLAPVSPDLGDNQADVKRTSQKATVSNQKDNDQPEQLKDGSDGNVQGAISSVGSVPLRNFGSGMRGVPGNQKEDIARTFHNALINATVDLISLTLKIWGDPYFISDSGVGNYSSVGAGKGGKAMIDPRGMMVYKTKMVYIHIGFRTPIDIGRSGVAEFVITQDNETKNTAELEKFSGIYRLYNVTSEFTNGRFEQTLELLRERNQSAQATNVKKPDKNADSGKLTVARNIHNDTNNAVGGFTGGSTGSFDGVSNRFA